LNEPFGDLERAAVLADVLSQNEDALVARHFFEERLPNRLEIRDGCHDQRAGGI
jgi:hypothetical protein